jgi:hypothetical protein
MLLHELVHRRLTDSGAAGFPNDWILAHYLEVSEDPCQYP